MIDALVLLNTGLAVTMVVQVGLVYWAIRYDRRKRLRDRYSENAHGVNSLDSTP